jgi:hypothetical protein
MTVYPIVAMWRKPPRAAERGAEKAG